jgi:hypothetical protein
MTEIKSDPTFIKPQAAGGPPVVFQEFCKLEEACIIELDHE